MVVAALKTLTWSTVVAAVASALLLAWSDGSMPRLGGADGESRHAPNAAPARGGSGAQAAVPAHAAQPDSAHALDRAVQ